MGTLEDLDVDGNSEIDDNNAEDNDGLEEITGWADSMSKILKSTKPKNKKTLILSRARKDYEVNKTTKASNKPKDDLEIAVDDTRHLAAANKDQDGEKEGKDDDALLSFKQQRKLELRQRKLERAWENLNRLTAEQPDKELETDLVKIATKGVVQLFNAVAQQQKTLKTKLRASHSSEFKKEKVLSQSKEIFAGAMSKSKVLGKVDSTDGEVTIKNESSTDDEDESYQNKQRKRKSEAQNSGSSKKHLWQALQDDFMLDAKLKDWDKDSDTD